jgi:hypothetical protein
LRGFFFLYISVKIAFSAGASVKFWLNDSCFDTLMPPLFSSVYCVDTEAGSGQYNMDFDIRLMGAFADGSFPDFIHKTPQTQQRRGCAFENRHYNSVM